MRKLLLTLFAILTFTHVQAADEVQGNSQKTKESFEKIINDVIDLYASTMKDLGNDLKINMDWENETINANVEMDVKNGMVFNFFGGLYRSPSLTEDAYALVVCHEIGHYLAGAPFYPGYKLAVEGQADFWATSVCLKKYFLKFPQPVKNIPLTIKENCDRTYTDRESRNLCYRSSKAGISAATHFNTSNHLKLPDIDFPDQIIKKSTNSAHPEGQCRLDTYFAGALCVPQDTSFEFQKKLLNEGLLSDSLCVVNLGEKIIKTETRPKCWFNEKVYETFYARFEKKTGSNLNENIYIDYSNSLAGVYKYKIVPDENTEKYVTVTTNPNYAQAAYKKEVQGTDIFNYNETEYTKTVPANAAEISIKFNYSFKKRFLSRKLKFYFVVERDGKVISEKDHAIEVDAVLWAL